MASSSASSFSKKPSNHSKFQFLSESEMMAVTGRSSSKLIIHSNDDSKKKMIMKESVDCEEKKSSDSKKLNSCHQCRQKTENDFAKCKAVKKLNKICLLKYCTGCLLKRYGEVAEEVDQLGYWRCPKCRKICNCSCCLKKKGLNPTGNLSRIARRNGYRSVNEMLEVQGLENVCGTLGKRNSSNKDKIDDDAQTKKAKRTRVSKKANVDTVKVVEDDRTEWGNAGTVLQSNTSEENIDEVIPDILLPQGVDLTTAVGIDIPPKDIGNALQFLQFCEAFGEVLDMKQGEAESILQELTNQSSSIGGQYSVVIKFYIQLLSWMQKDMREKSTLSSTNDGTLWLHALEKFISESNRAILNLPLDKDGVGYDSLTPSEKLRLLNFLCDETLSTVHLRNWIDAQNSRLTVKLKEAKDKVADAKEKEKSVKQKMGEVTKDFMAKNGASSSTSEYGNLVSQIKAEASLAHADTVEAIDMVPKRNQRSDAVRTDPLFLDGKGYAFWRFRSCSSEPNILLQVEEKWFIYDKEKTKEVEKYISSARRKSRRRRQVASNRHALEQVTQA